MKRIKSNKKHIYLIYKPFRNVISILYTMILISIFDNRNSISRLCQKCSGKLLLFSYAIFLFQVF